MLHNLSILGVPGEVAEGFSQADIIALLKQRKSFHTILRQKTENKQTVYQLQHKKAVKLESPVLKEK